LPAGLVEREITFKTVDGLTLPGTLTLPEIPKKAPKPPIAVLEQGSGVQDRDATIGPNKFFQQLAWGLATRGVATVRYDRRGKVDPANLMQHLDLNHEVVLDAASALAFAQTIPETDASRVFFVGHSLGAQLAPDVVALRLSQKPDSVRGMVLMSGVARPIDVVINQQMRDLGKAQGGTPEQITQLLAMWDAVWKAARDPETPDGTPLGVGSKIPAGYWRDWMKRNPVATMKTLTLPTLVMRGAADMNSLHEDFVMLSAKPGVTAKEFPGLYHLYTPNASPLAAGTVAPEVFDYLAAWILSVQ
jgi:pimeloyl-ACP methyl ester carboxylesterase